MLPIILPQFGELLKFDNSINNMDLLPEEAVNPDAGFSELLRLSLDELPSIDLAPGDGLPQDGNALPPDLAVTDISTDAEATATELVVNPLLVTDLESEPVTGLAVDLTLPRQPEIAVSADIESEPLPLPNTIATSTNTQVATPADDVRLAAVEDVAKGPRQPQPATPLPAMMQSADAAIDDAADTEVPLLRPLADMKTRARRTGQPAAVDASTRDLPVRMAVEQVPATAAATDRPLPRPLEFARDDAGLRIANLQQSGQSIPQPVGPQSSPIHLATQPALVDNPTAPLQAQTTLINTPVTDSAWGNRLGERVMFMAGNQLKSAEIRLTPAELGPVRVQVSVDDGAATVTFHAQHAVTREAIEQAIPRLREMLVENGLTLGQTSVGEQGVANQGNTNRDAGDGSLAAAGDADDQGLGAGDDLEPGLQSVRVSDGLVDTFA
jgi:flagellar hook-length control protein FliK